MAFICGGLLPAPMVAQPMFQALLMMAKPSYACLATTSASRSCLTGLWDSVLKEMNKASWCAMSTDMRASLNQKLGYVTLAVQFLAAGLSGDLLLASWCLKMFEVPEDNMAVCHPCPLGGIHKVEPPCQGVQGHHGGWQGPDIGLFVAGRPLAHAVSRPCVQCNHSARTVAAQACRAAVMLSQAAGVLPAVTHSLLQHVEQAEAAPGCPTMLLSDRVPTWASCLAMLLRL